MADAEDPRVRLAALARAGRAQQEAADAAQELEARIEAAEAAEQARRHERLMSFTTWSSLSGWMQLVWWMMFLPLLPMFLVLILGARAWLMFSAFALSAMCGLAALLGTWRARRRDIEFRAALPFPVLGYEALLGTRARSVRCELEFISACPPPQMFADLLRPLKDPTELQGIEGAVLKLEADAHEYSLLDDHCRWVPGWFRAFNKAVLQPVHAVYPIRSVRLH